jgi:hypothetical protein
MMGRCNFAELMGEIASTNSSSQLPTPLPTPILISLYLLLYFVNDLNLYLLHLQNFIILGSDMMPQSFGPPSADRWNWRCRVQKRRKRGLER